MSYFIEFDSTNRILRVRFEGPVSEEDLKELNRLTLKYFALTAPRVSIMDFSAATSFGPSPQTIREMAQSPPLVRDPTIPRFIVAPAPHIFGMARMYQLQGEETRPNLHVVHTLEEVWEFLGVQEPKFEPVKAE